MLPFSIGFIRPFFVSFTGIVSIITDADGIIKKEILEGISSKTPDTPQSGTSLFQPKVIDPSKIQLNMNFSKSELKTVFDVLTLIGIQNHEMFSCLDV